MNIAKFLRAASFKNICERLLLHGHKYASAKLFDDLGKEINDLFGSIYVAATLKISLHQIFLIITEIPNGFPCSKTAVKTG